MEQWDTTLSTRIDELETKTEAEKYTYNLMISHSERFNKILNFAAKGKNFGAGYDNHIAFKVDEQDYVLHLEMGLDDKDELCSFLKLVKIIPNIFAKSSNPDLKVDTIVLSQDDFLKFFKFKKLVERYILTKQLNNRVVTQNNYLDLTSIVEKI